VTKRGRPKVDLQINREVIVSIAFEILEEFGPQGLSMRSLATRLNVTPMALYNYFPDRAALIREMSDTVYARVVKSYESQKGNARSQIRNLLRSYYQACLKYPHLTVLIFETPGGFSKEVQQINFLLKKHLDESKLSAAKKKMWFHILADFTHGSALAIAHSQHSKENMEQCKLKYRLELEELLRCIL
jgi:AcrR family transcriptional regulator